MLTVREAKQVHVAADEEFIIDRRGRRSEDDYGGERQAFTCNARPDLGDRLTDPEFQKFAIAPEGNLFRINSLLKL